MKQLFPVLIAAVCIAAGSYGGYMLKPSSVSSAKPASQVEDTGSHGDTKKDSESPVKKADSHGASTGGHGSEAGAGDSGDVTYYKFTREFVVPMVEDERVRSLVILNINLEIDTSISQELFSKEPVLRDNIMTTLIKLSSGGRTLYSITEVENYETLRSTILANLRNEVPHGIHNVLILDMARQDL